MSGDVMKFIMMVETFFPRPKFAGDEKREALWMRTMRDILGGMDDETLARAAKIIIETRNPDKDGPTFPKPQECIAACADASGRIAAEQPRPLLAAPSPDTWSDERLSLAFDLCKSELGRRAAREGWIGSLYEYCRKNMELPRTDAQISSCIQSDRALRELVNEAHARAEASPSRLNTGIAKLCDGFIRARAERATQGDQKGGQ